MKIRLTILTFVCLSALAAVPPPQRYNQFTTNYPGSNVIDVVRFAGNVHVLATQFVSDAVVTNTFKLLSSGNVGDVLTRKAMGIVQWTTISFLTNIFTTNTSAQISNLLVNILGGSGGATNVFLLEGGGIKLVTNSASSWTIYLNTNAIFFITNGLAGTNYVVAATNALKSWVDAQSFATQTYADNAADTAQNAAEAFTLLATNTLASTNYVRTSTNGLAGTNYVNNATNDLNTSLRTAISTATNGLAGTNYVNGATNDLASWINTQGYATTNYVRTSTNGLAGTNYVNNTTNDLYTTLHAEKVASTNALSASQLTSGSLAQARIGTNSPTAGQVPSATGTDIKWIDSSGGSSTNGLQGTNIQSTTITIAGTANQITSSAGAQDLSANRTWTLSLPQNYNTTATPQLGGLGIGQPAADFSLVSPNGYFTNSSSSNNTLFTNGAVFVYVGNIATNSGFFTGLSLSNAATAISNNQQFSPTIWQYGSGHKTTATAGPQVVGMGTVVVPVQGAANPTFTYYWLNNVNGTVTSNMNLTSGGTLTVNKLGIASGGVSLTLGNGLAGIGAGSSTIQLWNANSIGPAALSLWAIGTLTKTANYTIGATDSGNWFNNNGSIISTTNTVLVAVAGYHFGGTVSTNNTLAFAANSADVFFWNGYSGSQIYSSTTNDSIHYYSPKAGVWIIDSLVGNGWAGLTNAGGIGMPSTTPAPVAITFPATTANWTNTTGTKIELYIDNVAITGTAITKNGGTILSSLISGYTMILEAGEYFSETYSVGTPTAKYSPVK